jgi:hypothetical protein
MRTPSSKWQLHCGVGFSPRETSEGVAKFEEPLACARLGMASLYLQEPGEPRARGSGRSAEYCNSLFSPAGSMAD